MIDSTLPNVDALRSPDCVPPQMFLAAQWQALSATQRAQWQQHADACPICQVERELAEAFDAPPSAFAQQQAAMILNQQPAARAANDAVLWRGAVAAVLGLCAIGLGAWLLRGGSDLPQLPQRAEHDAATRGAAIMLLAPDASRPDSIPVFRWSAVPQATHYSITVRDVAGDVMWTRDVTTTQIDVPAHLVPSQVRRHWDVQAFDAQGRPLARSAQGVY